jgi:hypothetical protein
MIRSPAVRQDSTIGQELLEGRDQSRSPTVAQADPKNSSWSFGAVGEMEKIFIFADNDAPLLVGIPADFCVGCFC